MGAAILSISNHNIQHRRRGHFRVTYVHCHLTDSTI
jgi:hypothetical protein